MAFRCREVLLVVLVLHAVAVWSDTCPAGQVPDGIGGHCVSCGVCEKYPTSPFCEQCTGTSKQSGGRDDLKIGLGVTAAVVLIAVAAGALWYCKPWRNPPVLQPNQPGVQQPPQVVVNPQEEHRPCINDGCAALLGHHQPMRRELHGHAQEEQGARGDRNPSVIAVGSYHQPVEQQQMDAQPLLPLVDHDRNTAPKEARDEQR